ncbi:MAG: steroid C27-monooxygenase, partial [Myxococcales bacterium]
MTAAPNIPAGFDPTDPDVLLQGKAHEQYAELRKNAPVHWIEQQPEAYAGFVDEGAGGYWAVTRHADISEISKNSKDFSTALNGAIIRFAPDMTREQVELQSVMMINQDDPGHGNLRRIIS